jgi:hypothetical protein
VTPSAKGEDSKDRKNNRKDATRYRLRPRPLARSNAVKEKGKVCYNKIGNATRDIARGILEQVQPLKRERKVE